MPLTSTDVGRRVVVRRVVAGEVGPSGGPAMTDVVGTLVASDEATLTVEPENGDSVVIAWDDVVAAKPVPPRPVRRTRPGRPGGQ